ncbi:mannose-6-phosphate isomerase, class I [Lysinibacillus piscis]|uniref:Mannose-6-phosphate isomerase n=1 Tax=Lysinibacillus piscis TaxID=2518931 RepID=A0ABQ5NN78_9BACI|nr:mannose-6-phosphate isomerase, class I [Lysinibacillus sp. KH24]GLC89568.1 putative mannose-6-phosphate isomerase YvyI [Lysinibacillus sp. KH24]
MNEPIFLKPIFKERIWGGTALRDYFGYDIPSPHTGECWAVSAHPNGPSVVANGPLKGKTLIELWNESRHLFGDIKGDVFPLLTKALDSADDLSVQVHPGNYYAGSRENGELGKNECWYVIDCEEGAEVIYGHYAQTREEFLELIEKDQWDKLLRWVPIKPGDFFNVPNGTIHALCKGALILETQQSSDTTYRLYDYGRTDDQGHTRELHIDKALDVSNVPDQGQVIYPLTEDRGAVLITTYLRNDYFSVHKWAVEGEAFFKRQAPFLIVSVISGDGEIRVSEQVHSFSKGNHFIIPAGIQEFFIEGSCELIVSHL